MKKLLLAITTLTLISCSTKKDIDISDYPIVTTVHELGAYYDLKIDTTGMYESTDITRYIDGSVELEYEYDLLESYEYDPLYYSITIEKELTVKDAIEVYAIGLGTVKMMGNSFEQGLIQVDSLDLPGDQSYYAMRTYDGELNGMFYNVRKGKTVFTMMVSGIYTEDHSLITDLMLPKIEKLEEFKLVKKTRKNQ